MVSCSEEEIFNGQGGDVVTFNVSIPELSTRAIGEGTSADRLYWGVYDQKNVLLKEISNFEGQEFSGSTSVRLTLAKEKAYNVIFWAANKANSMCTIHWHKRKMSVEPLLANQESYDAFCSYETIDNVSGYMTRDVKLRRPFAQLNIGTADIKDAGKAGLTVENTKVRISGLPKTYDFVTGNTDDLTTFTYDCPKEAVSFDGEQFPVAGYEYLSMNYALIGKDKQLVDVTFSYIDDDGQQHNRNYNSVPLQRNWRTNIYGNILTSDADFNVMIEPEFNGAHNIDLAWDGRTITEPSVDNDEKVLTIYSGEQLAWLAASVNGTLPVRAIADANTYEGWTIKLAADINLNNQQWTPIGKGEFFKGVFEGNNHTISNLKYSFDGEDYYVGLFGNLQDAVVKNLTINNVDIHLYGEGTWGHIGAVAGWAEGKSVLDSINITGSVKIEGHMEAEGSHRIGAIVGGNQSGEVSFTNITVDAEENSYVKGQAYVGGIAGQLQGKATFDNCSSNIDVIAYKHFAGGIVGNTANKTTFENCNVSADVSVLAGREGNANDLYRVGGIAGGWQDIASTTLRLTNCSYEGTLAGKDAAGVVANGFDCGGYVGRGYSATVGASVDVNGTVYTYQGNGVYLVNGVYKVSSCAGLQSILDNANISGDIKIAFICDIKGNATVVQKEGVNYVINGGGNKFDGTFYIHGQARYEGAETLKFENINFTTSKSGHYFIDSNSTASAERYAHNVTVEDCSFFAEGDAVWSAAAMRIRQGFDITVVGGKAKNMHSLLQAYGCTGVSIDGVTIEDGKNGISFGTSTDLALTNSTIAAKGYGVRADGTTAKLEVSATSITAAQPVIVRKLTKGEYSLAIGDGVELNTDADYQIVFTNGSDDAEYSAPKGTYTLTGADNFTVYPIASASAFTAALNNPELEVVSLDGKVESVGNAFEIRRSVILNMNNHELNAGSTATSLDYAIEAYGDYEITINDANLTRAGISASDGADIVFNSGIINHKPERTSRYIFTAHSGSTITIYDGTFTNDRANNSFFWADDATIYVKGGNFGGAASSKKIVLSNGGQVIITGGTFNFDPSEWVAAGYKATKTGSTWTVAAE